MKYILIGSVLSFISIYFVGAQNENGDMSAVGMYFVVFLIPCLIIAIVNGITLWLISNGKLLLNTKRALSSLMVLILLVVWLMGENISIPFFDGALSGVGIIGSIAIGVTNIYWNYNLNQNDINC